MQLLEYQAKELLTKACASVPSGFLVRPNDELGALPFDFPAVVKSQVPVGGRGKLGGVKLVRTGSELQVARKSIEALEIKGHLPTGILVEQALNIDRELYLSLRVNRDLRRVEWLASASGGVEVESNADELSVIPFGDSNTTNQLTELFQVDKAELEDVIHSLERCFFDNDLLLLEINPLVVTSDGRLVCADAKIMVDDNAQFRHPELDWPEANAIKPLGGNIGVIANGAGMAMSTMDSIYAAGARPANFLDIGGGTGEDVFVKNLREITKLPGVTSIIINIFAGITRCDDIARGIIAAKAQIPDLVPLFIRLEGTNRDQAAELLKEAGVELQPSLASCITLAIKHEDETAAAASTPRKATKGVVQPEKDLTETVSFPVRNGGFLGVDVVAAESGGVTASSRIFTNSPTIVQGITGHHGAFHTEHMKKSGTNIVAGVTPGKGGDTVHGVPVYDTVKQAVQVHRATTSVIFVPAKFARAAMFEAMDAGIRLIVCITEGIPVHDMLAVHARASKNGVAVVGPNCPGLIVPGSHKLGIIAEHITTPGGVTVISRSGTLTYELADALSKKSLGQRLILGIGGDPVQGMTFVEALQIAENDPGTKQIIMVGEIGGESENLAADFVASSVTKPVHGLVVGHSLPAGQTFGHAGAIVGGKGESAAEKTAYMSKKGIRMSQTLDELILELE